MRTVSYRSFASHALASAPGRVRVPLDKDLHGCRQPLEYPRLLIIGRAVGNPSLIGKVRLARYPEMIDAGFYEVFAKKLNVKLKLQACLVPVFFVADFPTKRLVWTFLEDILHNR